MRARRVSVIIPALDEEAVIGQVVRAVPRDLVQEIIVVDNGCRDRTAEVAQAAGARVVRESVRGYGAACRTGIRAATEAEIFVFCDGDGSDDPREMPAVLQPILDRKADFVIGARMSCEEGALTPQQRVGNRLVLFLIRILYGLTLTDLGPFRAITAEALRDLEMEHRTYGWPVEMIVKAARKGYRIVEVPTSCRKRIGRSKVAGTVKGSLLAGYHLILTTLRYAWRQ
jgi:glycosyltransferase involved in cell wall biosynthesis